MAKNAQTATEVVLSGENSKFEPGWNSLKYPFFDCRIHFRKVFFFTFFNFKPFDLNIILTLWSSLVNSLLQGWRVVFVRPYSVKRVLRKTFICSWPHSLHYLYYLINDKTKMFYCKWFGLISFSVPVLTLFKTKNF